MVIKFYIIIYMSFLDIWNNLLKFNKNNIFIIFDKDGNIWFGMKDLFKALGYTSLKLMILRFGLPKKYIAKLSDIKGATLMKTPLNIQPPTKMNQD